MIQFNELRISQSGDRLIIDVSVKDLEYYTNVYLSEILIDTQDTYTESGPSSKAISKKIENNLKSIRLELSTADMLPSLQDNMFFVYIKTVGNPSPDTPCGEDNSITLGVTLYIYNILQSFLCSLKELDNKCTIPKLFIDNYLRFKALQLSISTNHYTDAIKYYNKFFKNIDVLQVKSNCKCLS